MNLVFEFVVISLFHTILYGPIGVDTFYYCRIQCGKHMHTMCRWPTDKIDFSDDCKNSKVRTGFLGDEKKAIVHEVNAARATVANGGEGQPRASDMMKMTWNYEAARIAQRWANQCQFGHDACAWLVDGTAVGQNGFWGDAPLNGTALAAVMVGSWLQQVRRFEAADVDEFGKSPVSYTEVGHYTALVWARSRGIGCGKLEQVREDGGTRVGVVCNFVPTGNVKTERMYKRGEPCAECPGRGKCSRKYPGLCLADEDDEDDESLRDDVIVNTSREEQESRSHQRPSVGDDATSTDDSTYGPEFEGHEELLQVVTEERFESYDSDGCNKPSQFIAIYIVLVLVYFFPWI